MEQDFKVFTSDERMDAFEIIQKGFREKTDVSAKRLTCVILEVGAVHLYDSCSFSYTLNGLRGISPEIEYDVK